MTDFIQPSPTQYLYTNDLNCPPSMSIQTFFEYSFLTKKYFKQKKLTASTQNCPNEFPNRVKIG